MGDHTNKLLLELAQVKENIKRKYNDFRKGQSESEVFVKRKLKPIIEPLNIISQKQIINNIPVNDNNSINVSGTDVVQPINVNREYNYPTSPSSYSGEEDYSRAINVFESSFKEHPSEYTTDQIGYLNHKVAEWLISENKDKIYGPKKMDMGTVIYGDKVVEHNTSNASIRIDGILYQLTPGLVQLIFSKNPIAYTKSDLQMYKNILIQTSAHLTGNRSKIKQGGRKYTNIISKLFKNAKGLELTLNENIEKSYKYWNSADELIDRLRLLLSSQAAGNTAHGNEIVSIFEELYEAKIIKKIPNV